MSWVGCVPGNYQSAASLTIRSAPDAVVRWTPPDRYPYRFEIVPELSTANATIMMYPVSATGSGMTKAPGGCAGIADIQTCDSNVLLGISDLGRDGWYAPINLDQDVFMVIRAVEDAAGNSTTGRVVVKITRFSPVNANAVCSSSAYDGRPPACFQRTTAIASGAYPQ